jgi:hypothetical protein
VHSQLAAGILVQWTGTCVTESDIRPIAPLSVTADFSVRVDQWFPTCGTITPGGTLKYN